MKFPKFWAHRKSGSFSSWQWSDNSVEEARALADEAARRLEMQFKASGRPAEQYGYANRPLREPVLREIVDPSGQVAHVVTRNSYGCQVLNSSAALFVDVDLPEPQKTGILGSLFGGHAADPVQAALAMAKQWADRQPGWTWRIYRTKAGLRLLATQALFDPADPVCESVFDAVNADPLYRKLCQTQKCFRARLTPKPWRCGVESPPTRWPFANLLEEREFTDWNARYQSACRAKATCQLLEPGGRPAHTDLQSVIAFHDEMTRVTSQGLALA